MAKSASAQKVEGSGGEEDRNCDGDCIKSDINRVGEAGIKMIDIRNWKLLTDSVVTEK